MSIAERIEEYFTTFMRQEILITTRKREDNSRLRGTYVLLSVLLGLLLVILSSMVKVEVYALGTGIGIREDGPTKAQVGDTISYAITVINLGDYWDRNITVTDRFPNGTSSSWNIPDLAPILQPGVPYFTISGIRYTVKLGDVLPQQPPNIVNNAKVTGYADISGSPQLVQAETNFPTIILTPPVAIFAISDDQPLVNETVIFNASSSYDPDGHIVKFEWDWESEGKYDFDAGTNPIATHAYSNEGTYYPTLRVTDNDGLTNETTERIVVHSPALVVGGYSISFETACPQTPSIICVILVLTVTAASGYLYFQFKHIRISLNGLGRPVSQCASEEGTCFHVFSTRNHR